MPSLIANVLNAVQTAQGTSQTAPAAQGAQINPNMMNALNQFRGMFGGVLSAQNPAEAVQAIFRQRGIPFEQVMNRYAAQATEIQRQLTGR